MTSRLRSVVRERGRSVEAFVALAIKDHVPRFPVRPLVAELFLTENCNLRCTSCACWRSTTRGELSTGEWKSVIDQLRGVGVTKVNFTGGEPLLRRDTVELIGHARATGFRSLHLNTNAMLLDDRRRTAVLEAGVRSFNVSIDGPDATAHDKIRGVEGSFERTIEHLRALVRERAEHRLAIRMNATVLRDNVEMLPRLGALAQSIGVRLYLNLGTDTTFLFRHEEVTRVVGPEHAAVEAALDQLEWMAARDRRWLPRPADLHYVRAHLTGRAPVGLRCAESQIKLLVHSDGAIGGCWGHDPSANVRTSSIRDVVAGENYREEHERFYRKDCVGCGSGYSLNLRRVPSSYLDDARWHRAHRAVSEG